MWSPLIFPLKIKQSEMMFLLLRNDFLPFITKCTHIFQSIMTTDKGEVISNVKQLKEQVSICTFIKVQ